jgi:hypothetical protein
MFISEAEMMGYSPGPILRFIDWLLGRLAELRRPKNPQQRDD